MEEVGASHVIRLLEDLLAGRRSREEVRRWAVERWSSAYVEPEVPIARECGPVFEHLRMIDEPGRAERGEEYVLREADMAHDLATLRNGGVAPDGSFDPREVGRLSVTVGEVARRAGRPTIRHLLRGLGWREQLIVRRPDNTGGFAFEQDYAQEEQTRVHASPEEGAAETALRTLVDWGLITEAEVVAIDD